MVKINRKEFLASAGKWKLEKKTVQQVIVNGDKKIVRVLYHGVGYQYTLVLENEGDPEKFEAWVELDKLVKAVKASKDEVVTLEQFGDKGLLVDGFAKVPAAEGSPLDQFVFEGERFSIPEGVWDRIVDLVVPHVSDDETRYFMNGVFFEHKEGDDNITFVGTNGRTLAKMSSGTLPEISSLKSFSIIVPFDNILLFVGSDVDCLIGERYAEFATKSENGTFLGTIVKLIEGQYPNYGRVIPEKTKKNLRMNTAELETAMKKIVSCFGKKDIRRAVFTIEDNGLTIETGSASLTISAKTPKADIGKKFAMNPDFILDSIGFEEETVFNYSEMAHAFRIDDSLVTRVIMPMSIDA